MHPQYIVLAHLPIEKDNAECEWVIFDGVHGKTMAEAQATKFRQSFREVQIRELFKTL
jgi:hypothetical protein